MKKNLFAIAAACCVFTLSSFVYSKNHSVPVVEENCNIALTSDAASSFYYVLDNRYEGGSDAFIALFSEKVKYPKEAFENCRVGLSKINLEISQAGTLENFEFTNPLEFGIEKSLTAFFEATKGNWKKWARSSRLEMTVGFSLITKKDSYYPDADLLVLEKSAYKWSTGDIFCDTDAQINKKIKKYFKKKKHDKAIPLLEELLRRHPDNAEFAEQKKLAKSSK